MFIFAIYYDLYFYFHHIKGIRHLDLKALL